MKLLPRASVAVAVVVTSVTAGAIVVRWLDDEPDRAADGTVATTPAPGTSSASTEVTTTEVTTTEATTTDATTTVATSDPTTTTAIATPATMPAAAATSDETARTDPFDTTDDTSVTTVATLGASGTSPAGDTPSAGDIAAVPVVAPVAIGSDPSIRDRLLASSLPPDPSSEAGADGHSAVIGGVEVAEAGGSAADPGDPADDALGGGPLLLDDTLFPRPERAVDACADVPPAPGCPPGYAATISGPGLPPDAFVYISRNPLLPGEAAGSWPCPADTPPPGPGQDEVKVYSVTPLRELVLQWRTFGSARPWTELAIVPASLPEHVTDWTARLDGEAHDRSTWDYVMRCATFGRDADQAVEVRARAIDIYGVSVVSNLVVYPDATPTGRPPTTATIDGHRVTVTAFTQPGGFVEFRRHVVESDSDTECPTAGGALRPPVAPLAASPPGVWDPAWSVAGRDEFTLPPGGMVVVCATIYDTENELRPYGRDVLLVRAPTEQRPVITLEAVRVDGGGEVDGSLSVRTDSDRGEPPTAWHGAFGPCDRAVWFDDGAFTDRAVVEHTLWECGLAALPAAPGDVLHVPIQLGYSAELGSEATGASVIPVHLADCADGCPSRPDEWYDIAFPGDAGASAIIRVSYPVIDGAVGGRAAATLTSSRSGLEPTTGSPIVRIGGRTTFDEASLTFSYDVTVFADRPVTFRTLRIVPDDDAAPGCNSVQTIALSAVNATDDSIDVTGICPRTGYSFDVVVVDASGVDHELVDVYSLYLNVPMRAIASAQVEFLGGPAALGLIYGFDVSLDDYPPLTYPGGGTPVWTWNDSSVGSDGRCRVLERATVEPLPPGLVELEDGALDVDVRVTVTAFGELECGDTDLPRVDLHLTGHFTLAQLASGSPLVLETPPDSTVRLRITVTADEWRAG